MSIPFFTDTWKPYSFVQKIFKNLKHNLHTLCLLDIKVKELKESDVCKGYTIKDKQPLPPRYMSNDVAIAQIEESCLWYINQLENKSEEVDEELLNEKDI